MTLFEEAEKLPIKERVPFFERLLEAGTINEPIRDVLDDRSKKELDKIYLEFGSERFFALHRKKDYFHKIREQGRKLFRAEREDKEGATEEDLRCQAEDLAVNVAGILNNEACPGRLRSAITDALCDLQTTGDCLGNVDFLMGLFLSKPRQVEQAEGGAA